MRNAFLKPRKQLDLESNDCSQQYYELVDGYEAPDVKKLCTDTLWKFCHGLSQV